MCPLANPIREVVPERLCAVGPHVRGHEKGRSVAVRTRIRRIGLQDRLSARWRCHLTHLQPSLIELEALGLQRDNPEKPMWTPRHQGFARCERSIRDQVKSDE